jgi:nucleoredoxin
MASWAVELVGKELLTKNGIKATEEVVVDKKAVLIYFSAHWCPPCRAFTPVLADAYKKYSADDVEVVFVSSDRDESSFSSYFSEMPWTAVPFVDRERKNQLSQKFNVQGIPMLIVLNGADGTVASQNGRGEVMKTKDLGQSLALWGLSGSCEPIPVIDDVASSDHWAVRSFGDIILTKTGKKSTREVVSGKKIVLVYFSAHWCPPCRGFTPVLADAYKKYGAGDVEVVFVSSDRDESSFSGYYSEMPWTAVPFSDTERKSLLSQKFDVQGIPMLVVLDGETGDQISVDGRGDVMTAKGDLHQCVRSWGSKGRSAKKSCCCVIS